MAAGSNLDVEVIEGPDNKYFCPHYAKKLSELLFEAAIWSKLLKTFEDVEEKQQLHFYQRAKTKFTNCHAELFFRTKKLDKTKLRYIFIKTYSLRRGSQSQFVDSCSKTERKISKKETKVLTHALGLSKEQSSDKSDDEERNQPTTECKFEESWQEKPPTKRKRDRGTYLSSPSKKIKFKMKMKNKENAKVETSENASKSKKK